MHDDQIIALFNARDEAALLHAQRQYGRYLRSIAVNILADKRDADEAVNDGCLKAWELIPPAHPENLAAYIGKLVRNIALDKLRKRTAAKRGGGAELLICELEECVPGGAEPEKELLMTELAETVNAFLESLPKEKRILFMRRYWYSEPVKRIAKDMGKTPAAVGMELGRLRAELKKCLEERNYNV